MRISLEGQSNRNSKGKSVEIMVNNFEIWRACGRGGRLSILEFLKERGDSNAYVACGEYGYFLV